jgi:hypothetical protein
MNRMPDRIWATPYDADMDGGTYCDAAERPTSPNHDAWCYVRADLVRAEKAEADNARLRKALTNAGSHLERGLDKMAFNIIRRALNTGKEPSHE